MEDVSVRAITIGVGVLLAIVTISAVFMYYNTAKQTVRDIGAGTDIAGLYEKSVREVLVKAEGGTATITGTDVKNLLYYSLTDTSLKLNCTNIRVLEDNGNIKPDLTYSGEPNESQKNNIIKRILPNSKYNLTKSNTNYFIVGV